MAEKEKPKGGAAKTAAKGGKKVQKKYRMYEVTGDTIKRKNKMCPKCGPGIFLAEHKDRWACGKCGYMEKRS
jgi:small subunit ribosomal protein S27Ae